MKKYSREWKLAQRHWIQYHASDETWRYHYLDNATEYIHTEPFYSKQEALEYLEEQRKGGVR